MSRRPLSNTDRQAQEIRRIDLMKTAIEGYLSAQRMDIKELSDHVKRYSIHQIFPPLIGQRPITIPGYNALVEWGTTVRVGNSDIKARASSGSWRSAVCDGLAQALDEIRNSENVSDEDDVAVWLDTRVFECADAQISAQSGPLIYYFPCYLIRDSLARDFTVGPVRFVHHGGLLSRIQQNCGTKPDWFSDYDPDLGDRKQPASEFKPQSIAAQLEQFTWIAEVAIADCEPDMSRRRALDAIRLAVAGVALLLSPHQASQVGLADEWRQIQWAESLTQVPGEDVTPVGFRAWPEVGVKDGDLQRLLDRHKNYLRWLGISIETTITPLPGRTAYPCLRRRWINALYWYFVACTEPSSPRSIICFSTVLESLAGKEGADAITKLCANLMAINSDTEISESLTLSGAVQKIYHGEGRSGVVHGGNFVLDAEMDEVRGVAAMLAQHALFNTGYWLACYENTFSYREELDGLKTFWKWVHQKVAS